VFKKINFLLIIVSFFNCTSRSADKKVKNIELVDTFFVSPGINHKHPIILLAKLHKIKIIGDLDIFWKDKYNDKNKFIVITGTNGKSTVTSMLGYLLHKNKYQTLVAGNIGVPVLGIKTEKKPL
jgi:UDP-N-acetylmuramoylalanine-D-glutamate ligase